MPPNILLSVIGVMILAFVLFVTLSGHLFEKKVKKEIERLIADAPAPQKETFTYEDLQGLPEPLQRYLTYSIKDGQKCARTVRLKHTGQFRLKKDQGWMPIEGEEHFSATSPAFIWHARLKIAPLVWIEARDCYEGGEGKMLAKLLSTITLADSSGTSGRQMDQSALFRWLSEAPWFPTALLPGENLRWEEIDSGSARAIVQDRENRATATVYFDDEGRISRIVTTDKLRDVDGKLQEDKWTGYYRDYREMGGFRIPAKGEAVWNLEEGDFGYARFEVTEIEYGY